MFKEEMKPPSVHMPSDFWPINVFEIFDKIWLH